MGGRTNLGFIRLDQKNYLREKGKEYGTWKSRLSIAVFPKKVYGKSNFLSCISNGCRRTNYQCVLDRCTDAN